MAEPLRRVSGEPYPLPGLEPERQSGRNTDISPKRLISRQVRSNAQYRRTIAWLFLGMFAVLFLLGFSYTYVKAGVSRLNYQMHAVQNENEQIVLDNAKIMGQIAELRSLDRIEAIAIQELGMVKNESVEYMVLSDTIVAEGKIRPAEGDEQGEREKLTPLGVAFRYIADLIRR
ncbi:MAG: septum formation initiator family protein [Clostridiales bacterium]|nr:septum formation initiator family protein [Clostridiales bacterium]